MVQIKAEDLAKSIAAEGHAAVRQIYFDSGETVIKPESKPALDEIAKLMNDSPTLKVIFVGHTDSQGELQYNMALSQKRATAVRDRIRDEYGIDNERLGAAGIGFLAPVASNKSEEGRAENRRVELIEW
ncbi:MAG: OmpA family protein [Gammaproteobacteria bacterium]|nr:OmpA family protein [Gammaproteobacteria bacterium]